MERIVIQSTSTVLVLLYMEPKKQLMLLVGTDDVLTVLYT